MVMVMTGPTIRGEYIIDGQIDATDLADDSVGTTKIAAGRVQASHLSADAVGSLNVAANGVQACHLATRALSQNIMVTGPALGAAVVESIQTGCYSIHLDGYQARFAWARAGASTRFAEVFTLAAGGSGCRVTVKSVRDAGGSCRLVPAVSDEIVVCWMT